MRASKPGLTTVEVSSSAITSSPPPRRPATPPPGPRTPPPINVPLPKLAGLAVEDRPPRARFWLAWPLEGRAAKVAFRGRAHGDNPAQYLDLDAGDGSTVKPAIGRLEQLPDG